MISILLTLAMLVGAMAVTASPVMAAVGPSLSAGSVSGSAGETVEVPITLNSSGEVYGLQFELTFDPGQLSFVKGTAGSLTGSLNMFNCKLASGSTNTVKTMIFNIPKAAVGSGAGTVVVLEFKVGAGVQGGDSSVLDLKNVLLGDSSNQSLATTVNDGQFSVPVSTIAVSGVSLDQDTAILEIGGTVQLAASVAPTDATNQNVSWESDKEEVATVDNGLVTAVAAGSATVTVKTIDGSYTDSCLVTVNKAPVVESQKWYLDSTGSPVMEKTEGIQTPGSGIPVEGATVTWLSNGTAGADGVVFGQGTWTVYLNGNLSGACSVSIGESDGTAGGFKAFKNGAEADILQAVNATGAPLTIEISGVVAEVTAGHYLALQVTNQGTGSVTTDGSSYLSAPSSTPLFPLPEAAGWILFGLGAIGLVAFVGIRRKKLVKA